MGKLQAAYQLHAAHTGHPAAAWVLLFGGMGYRPPFPDDWEAAAEMVLADEARYLAEAELYILPPQMCDVVIAAAQSLTVQDLDLLSEEDLPGRTELVMLPHPIIVRTVGGDLADDRAFTWRFPSQIQRPAKRGRHWLHDLPAVRLSGYHDSYGPVRPDSFRDRPCARSPPLWACRRIGWSASTSPAIRSSTTTTHSCRGFLYAFWRLCEQQIAAVSRAETNHSARVLADRAGVPAEVRIVRLRRAAPFGATGQSSRDWQHRWVVRIHKVRQWYPSQRQHKVIYCGPCIKGPADKPLLEGEIVRALIR
jgi:hypothetical protein